MAFNLTTLSEYAKVQGGFAFKSKDFIEYSENRVLKIKNVRFGTVSYEEPAYISDEIAQSTEAWATKEGDILISMTGSGPNAPQSLVGRVARVWANEPQSYINQRVGRIQLLEEGKVHPDFLFYLLSLPQSQDFLVSNSSGSANQANISGKIIGLLPCPEVTYEESESIANMVRSLDEKIILNRQTNQTLEQMAQALFKSWFVDFDPVIDNALAAGNDIPEALQHKAQIRRDVRKQAQQLPASPETKSKPLPDDIRTLFPSEFEQTDEPSIGIAGWIPKGWRISSTDAELGIKGGSTPSTKNPDFWDGGDIHWTSPKDLSGNDSKILLDTSRKITEAGLAKITSGLLPVDTVLMSSRAPVGYLALAKVPLAINQGYIALECEKDLTPEYTMQFLDSIMDEIKGISGGTTFAEISKKTFRSIKLVVPSKPAIDEYTAIAKANYDKITENIKQTNSLTETRDYLLPKLISGDIKINKDVA